VSEAPPVIVVTGPTATGKTALAIQLALRIGAEIINADSMQVFRFMDIGTAKPSAEERALVPHHLLDIITPDVPYSAGRYAEDARAAAGKIQARGKRVLLVGGTGLYIRAFVHGLISGAAADPDLREQLERDAFGTSTQTPPRGSTPTTRAGWCGPWRSRAS
jgi:tRNA dimethylallyltransferase